jgi:hypothetical protein
MKTKRIAVETYKSLYTEHKTGKSLRVLATNHNMPYITLYEGFKRLGFVMCHSSNEDRKRSVIAADWFASIDTPEKAYYLGLLMADGCINYRKEGLKSPRMCLKLEKTDAYLIEQLRDFIQPALKLTTDKNSIKLEVTSTRLVKDLEVLGMVPNKTIHGECFTKLETTDLQWHFIRGYFDGDGSITLSERNKSTIYICCSNKSFLEELQAFVHTFSIETSLHTEDRSKLGYKPMYTLHFRSRVKFYNYLYKNATIQMMRKRFKYNHVNTVLTEKRTRQRRA